MQLPEKIRWTLNKIVNKMRTDENVYGIGLFGSWSRGDAAPTSDVDLFILDTESFNYEYTKRKEMNGLLIDFNHIPKKWLTGVMPPELDQRINELQILYDRDWTLSNTKAWVTKFYHTPERINIRTENHVVEADIYLSRATSALARQDHQSAQLYAKTAMEKILQMLLEIAKQPFSNSRFLKALEKATEKLEMSQMYERYLDVAKLSNESQMDAEEKLKLFKNVWDEASLDTKKALADKKQIHPQTRRKLEYYMNPLFLQGIIMRTKTLINNSIPAEATHYIQNTLIQILENYAWLKTQNTKLDLTTLIRALQNLQQPKIHQKTIRTLNLQDVNFKETEENIQKAKQTIKQLRKRRKQLIKTM